jgi:hypothetical protein
MISYAYYNSYKLRQLTGIPLTRICEVACEIAYDTLLERPDLLQETIRKYSVRSPERQLEIDLARGYLKVVLINNHPSRDKNISSTDARP